MKKCVVKFSRPLLINYSISGKPTVKTVYGFVAKPGERDELDEKLLGRIDSYVKYLAAMHEWSNGNDEFNIADDNNWIDKNGDEHAVNSFVHDKWVENICSRAVTKLELSYELFKVDAESVDYALDDEMSAGIIISKDFMEFLSLVADLERRCIFLFNRPVWVPKGTIWKGEKGGCLIYGVTVDCHYSWNIYKEAIKYLSYLAMCEEYYLAGVTPSGFVDGDDGLWYLDGIGYKIKDMALSKEGALCSKKNNLRLLEVLQKPLYYLPKGIRNGFILSQNLYEELLDSAEHDD